MISDVLNVVEHKFLNDWPGEIHMGSTEYRGNAESWINVIVEPMYNETLSYGGCVAEEHLIYVTCYHRNQTQAAKLADEVITFIQQKQLGEMSTRTWRPVNQGMMDSGKAFYKLSIPIEIIN